MRMLVTGLVLLMLYFTVGCSTELHYPRSQIGFWDQRVTFTGWGLTAATPYGPFNLGYLSWSRNIDKPHKPANPVDLLQGLND